MEFLELAVHRRRALPVFLVFIDRRHAQVDIGDVLLLGKVLDVAREHRCRVSRVTQTEVVDTRVVDDIGRFGMIFVFIDEADVGLGCLRIVSSLCVIGRKVDDRLFLELVFEVVACRQLFRVVLEKLAGRRNRRVEVVFIGVEQLRIVQRNRRELR